MLPAADHTCFSCATYAEPASHARLFSNYKTPAMDLCAARLGTLVDIQQDQETNVVLMYLL